MKNIFGILLISATTLMVACEKEETTTDTTTEESSTSEEEGSSETIDGEGTTASYPMDTVQSDLDSGKTPFELYKEGISVNAIIGKKYQGGWIASLDSFNGGGLICSPHREPAKEYYDAKFACEYFNNDGYYDWKFPSKKDINILYENLYKKGLGNFRDSDYWFNGSSSFGNLKSFKDGSIKVGLTGSYVVNFYRPVRYY